MILTHGANSLSQGGGGDFVEIGGRKYKYVQIGNLLWLAENLDYKFSGCDIGPTGSPSTPAAWYYNNDEATYGINGYKCGLLYNWYAVDYLNNHLSELGVPSGWHVPTDGEWTSLANAVGGTSTAGTKLKALDSSVTSSWPSGWNGTDDYGFGVLPAGGYGGSFSNVGSYASFWTTTTSGVGARFRFFRSTAGMYSDVSYMRDAVSVRLVHD